MFKRVAKRQRKREKEDELGLDEEMKQVLGLQDTDSDESFDSSDSESGNDSDLDSDQEEESEGDKADVGGKTQNTSRKRKHSANGSHSDSRPISSAEESSEEEGGFMSESADELGQDDRPPMGVIAATTNPIYDIPDAPTTEDLRACVLCPGKVLKNVKMVKVHVESTAHLRRLQRYVAQVSRLTSSPGGLITDDPRVILRDLTQSAEPVGQLQDVSSNRAQRKSAWKAKQAERKKARNQAKAEKTKKQDASVKDGVTPETGKAGRKPRESEGKKLSGLQDVPVSITVDLPKKTGAHTKDDAGERIAPNSADHPRKRRKHEPTLGTTSLTIPSVDSVAKPHSKNSSSNSQRRKPPLKRNNTSLYFADDEKRSGPLGKRRGSHPSTDDHEVQERRLKLVSGTKRRPDTLQGGTGHEKSGVSAGKEGDKKSRGRTISIGAKGTKGQ